jgi:mannosyltransferase OCH1-like enzyme
VTDIVSIVDAAECALHLALANNAFMDNSQIPLITHQTSRSADPETWSTIIRTCVERWLAAATGTENPSSSEMAWFMWDDDGIKALVQKYEHDLYPAFSALPYPVEKADLFRVLVLKWFGGIVSADASCLSLMCG